MTERRSASWLWRFATVPLALAFDLALLRPLLTSSALTRGEIERVYFEPDESGVEVLLDQQMAGYMTEVEVGDEGDLEIPSGRSIAVALRAGETNVVRTGAADLAPYVLLGVEERLPEGGDRDPGNRAARFGAATMLAWQDGALVPRPWEATRAWAQERGWLRDLRARCGGSSAGAVALRATADGVAIRLGDCTVTVPLAGAAARPPLLLVVSGLHGAALSRAASGWRQETSVSRELVGVALLRLSLLCAAVGAAATAVSSATLFAAGLLLRPAAMLVWFAALPLGAIAAAVRLVRRTAPRRPALAWAGGGLVLVVEVAAAVAAVALLDVGTFGKERFTRQGDEGCSVVGYSTVRGDSLRAGSEGLVERLDRTCERCRDRTSRFSREAQTLRWVREVVCAPSFPAPAGGEVVFFGGGNDDVFYRPGRLLRVLGVLLNLLRYAVQPVGAMDWETAFARANEMAVATIDEQQADIAAAIGCARAGGRRFWFVHDFLLWDLGRGRTPVREQTFAARRAAVAQAGGEFIDLYAELGDSAGLAWFNDWIHPSAYGQRQISDRLCARMEAAGAAATPAYDPPRRHSETNVD